MTMLIFLEPVKIEIMIIYWVALIDLLYKLKLNGRFSDTIDEFSCFTHNGQSIVDYIIGFIDFFASIESVIVSDIDGSSQILLMCAVNVRPTHADHPLSHWPLSVTNGHSTNGQIVVSSSVSYTLKTE